jgi:hypothetical protein
MLRAVEQPAGFLLIDATSLLVRHKAPGSTALERDAIVPKKNNGADEEELDPGTA